MELMKGLPDNILGIIGSGTITGEDYDTVIIPATKDKLQRHKKIRMLYQLNKDFVHYALDAYLEDAKVSWHALSFEKVAVVSDVHWINDSVNLYKFIIPVQVKVFSNSELDKAKLWVSELYYFIDKFILKLWDILKNDTGGLFMPACILLQLLFLDHILFVFSIPLH